MSETGTGGGSSSLVTTGINDLPASNLTLPDPAATERLAFEAFVRNQSATQYRPLLVQAYSLWHGYNIRFFDCKLLVPHIGVGRTHPRRFSQCGPMTSYGATIEIMLSSRIAFGTDARIVRDPWPAEGTSRLLADFVLQETVKQSVLQLRGSTEEGYGGYGPLFAVEATRIGPEIGLPGVEVLARRRGQRGRGQPVAAFWPWALRPNGYYLGHIDQEALLGQRPPSRSQLHSAIPGVYDYLLFLAKTDQIDRLIEVLGRQVDIELEPRSPATAAFENSPRDMAGMALPQPVIDESWLNWNGGCVRAMAKGIRTRRMFDGMPILADALQDAGCEDQALLDHCRADSQHTAKCWALKALLAVSQTE